MSDFDTEVALLGPTQHISKHATVTNVFVHSRGTITLLDSLAGYFVIYGTDGRAVERGRGSVAMADALQRLGFS
jgi:hypothetical protein